MKIVYCWRCQTDVPMLEADEEKEVRPLYNQALEKVEYLPDGKMKLVRTSIEERFRPVVDAYERITGCRMHHNVIAHHFISLYGPPCKKCEKLLRTTKASHCAACGLISDI